MIYKLMFQDKHTFSEFVKYFLESPIDFSKMFYFDIYNDVKSPFFE